MFPGVTSLLSTILTPYMFYSRSDLPTVITSCRAEQDHSSILPTSERLQVKAKFPAFATYFMNPTRRKPEIVRFCVYAVTVVA